jgi:hypothetical protein
LYFDWAARAVSAKEQEKSYRYTFLRIRIRNCKKNTLEHICVKISGCYTGGFEYALLFPSLLCEIKANYNNTNTKTYNWKFLYTYLRQQSIRNIVHGRLTIKRRNYLDVPYKRKPVIRIQNFLLRRQYEPVPGSMVPGFGAVVAKSRIILIKPEP